MKKTSSSYELHSDFCRTFSNSTRLAIINVLRDGELSVGELAEKLRVRQSNLSQHLAILRKVGAVIHRKDGQTVYYSISSPKIIQAYDLISEVVIERNRMNMKLLSAMSMPRSSQASTTLQTR